MVDACLNKETVRLHAAYVFLLHISRIFVYRISNYTNGHVSICVGLFKVWTSKRGFALVGKSYQVFGQNHHFWYQFSCMRFSFSVSKMISSVDVRFVVCCYCFVQLALYKKPSFLVCLLNGCLINKHLTNTSMTFWLHMVGTNMPY